MPSAWRRSPRSRRRTAAPSSSPIRAAFFPSPPPVAPSVKAVRDLPWGGECVEVSWTSAFLPFDAGRRRALPRACPQPHGLRSPLLEGRCAPGGHRDPRLPRRSLGHRGARVADPLSQPLGARRRSRRAALPRRARAPRLGRATVPRRRSPRHQRGLPPGGGRPPVAREHLAGAGRDERRRDGHEPRRLFDRAPGDARGRPGLRRPAHPARFRRRLRPRPGTSRDGRERPPSARGPRSGQPRGEPARPVRASCPQSACSSLRPPPTA